MNLDLSKTVVLHSSCKVTNGAKRSTLVDFARGQIYFISNEYRQLLEYLDRKPIGLVLAEIDLDSKENFFDFLKFLIEKELIFFANNDLLFIKKNDSLYEKEYSKIQDAIIEIGFNEYNPELFLKILQQLDNLMCKSLQFRFLDVNDNAFVEKIIQTLDLFSFNYLEIHMDNCNFSERFLVDLVKNHALLSNIYLYNCKESGQVKVSNNAGDKQTMTMFLGKISYLSYPFDNGNCCGIINFENLAFHDENNYRRNKLFNGCLYKKISIDKFGNIKNCPSMKNNFGNVENVKLDTVLKDEQFAFYSGINKDQIHICKDCEFRYCCTDCRAFVSNKEDVFSKPMKCNYNPYNSTWENF